MLDKQTVSTLLGRSLSAKEDRAFEEYIDVTKYELEEMLGMQLTGTTGEERVYDAREDYRTLFTDPFTAIQSVSQDGTLVEASAYRKALNDRRNAPWYNSIVFDCRMTDGDVTVIATWGFGETLPNDLQLLIARMFMTVANAEVSGKDRVRSKSIEDFSVSYDTNKTLGDQFMADNARIIAKYRRYSGEVQNGCV